ncbi:MAG: hypothetical protein I8H82_06455 [Rhodocyclales bacterium]|nr:hypothetical protein [Rhodocyclales bacterium]MBH1976092.1 hypothetical protein [Rhodocyclales bacterium]
MAPPITATTKPARQPKAGMEGASDEACEKSALMRRREGDSPDKMKMARNNSRHFLRRWIALLGWHFGHQK